MPSLNDTLLALAQTQNETARRLDRLERQGTSPAGAGPAGTVTSIGLSAPSWLTVSGSPITTYGTLALSATSQAPNMVLAGPASGGAAAPTFRALVAADLPAGMGLGTVTQVGLAMPAMFTVTGTPVTTTGTLTAALANQAGHAVFIGPNSGTPAAPTFRALVEQDLPASVVLAGSITVYPSGIFDPSTGGGPGDADFNLDFLTQSANTIFAGPASGGAVEPSFRAMVTADIPNAAVTYAKIQNVATARLLGRSTAGAGVVEEIAIGSGLSLAAGTLSATVDPGAYVPLAGGEMTGALGIGRTPGDPDAYQVVFPQGSSGASSPGIRLEGGQTDGGLAMNDGILEFWNNWRAYCSNVSGRLQGIFRFDTRSGYESEGFVIGGTLNDDTTDFMAFGINYGTGDVNLAYYGIGSVAIGTHTGAAGISGTNGNLAVYNDIYAGRNIIANSAGGVKLMTDPSQKLGVWNATPIVQPTTSIGAASFTAGSGTGVNDDSTFDGYTVGQVVQALRDTGLLA